MICEAFRLDGRTALVTGCSRGIGSAMAEALAEAGADIIGVSASLDAESPLGERIRALGRSFSAYQCDFSDRDDLYAFISRLKEEHPVIDILVNNAGMIDRAPAAEHPDAMWDKVIEVNLNSQFILSRELGKAMLERKRGKIIFTASLLSFQGGINVPSYAASKGGIARLTMALSNEWAPYNVQVNAIAPGYVATANTAALRSDAERSEAILARIPAGRWGKPDDYKGIIVFLASNASDYMTGQIVAIDGGWMAR